MSTSPLNLELDVLSAALAKLGIDVPATEVLQAINEEFDKSHAERPKKLSDEVPLSLPGAKKPILGRFIPEDDPAAHDLRLQVMALYDDSNPPGAPPPVSGLLLEEGDR